MSRKKRFGLFAAGIGAGVAGIALITNTLDSAQLIASTVLVLIGVTLYLVR